MGDPKRKREIDVLLSSELVGYPIRIALECKNEQSPTGAPAIDAFVGKLQDVGIPVAHGVFVSASGYTKGAIRRAKKAGVRALELRGLTSDRLGAALQEALHSVVYLVPIVELFSFFDRPDDWESGPREHGRPFILGQLENVPEGMPGLVAVIHQVWRLWMAGAIPATAGMHYCLLDVPGKFTAFKGGPAFGSGGEVITNLKVVAVALSIGGLASHLSLVNAETESIEKLRVEAGFRLPHKASPITMFDSETDLEAHLEGRASIRFTGRVRIPRLIYESFYWPLSQQAQQRFRKLREAGKKITFASLEGTDLSRAWEFFEERQQPEKPDKKEEHEEDPKASEDPSE